MGAPTVLRNLQSHCRRTEVRNSCAEGPFASWISRDCHGRRHAPRSKTVVMAKRLFRRQGATLYKIERVVYSHQFSTFTPSGDSRGNCEVCVLAEGCRTCLSIPARVRKTHKPLYITNSIPGFLSTESAVVPKASSKNKTHSSRRFW